MKKRYLILSIVVVLLAVVYVFMKRGIANIPEEAFYSAEELCA